MTPADRLQANISKKQRRLPARGCKYVGLKVHGFCAIVPGHLSGMMIAILNQGVLSPAMMTTTLHLDFWQPLP
jgi:hypothetical protein